MKIIILENSSLAIKTIRKDLVKSFLSKYDVKIYSLIKQNKNNEYESKLEVTELNLLNIFFFFKDCFGAESLLTFTIRPLLIGFFISLIFPKINFFPTITGTGPLIESKKIIYRILHFLYPTFLKKAKFIFFHNNADADHFSKWISKDKFCVVGGSGINLNNKIINRNTYELPNRPPKVVCFSRLLKDKGIIHFLEATEIIMQKYKFMKGNIFLAGMFWYSNFNSNTVSEDHIKKWIRRGGRFLGQPENKDKFYLSMDILCVPSYREGLSNILLEGGLNECILLASSVPGCIDIVDYNCGITFLPRSSQELFKALEKSINLSTQNQIRFRLNAKIKIKQYFSKDKVIAKYHERI